MCKVTTHEYCLYIYILYIWKCDTLVHETIAIWHEEAQ